MADASQNELAYVKETAWGDTPATPTMETLRFTSDSLAQDTQTSESQEVRSDRQIPDVSRTGASVAGDINAELSYGALDDFLESALCGTWQTDTPTAGTDRLENGTTFKSFTIEKRITDVSEYLLYTGCVVDAFSLSLTPGEILTATLGIIGKQETASGSSVATSTNPAPTAPVMNAVDDLTTLNEGGATATLTNIELQIANSVRQQMELGTLTPSGLGLGRFRLTGSLQAYFESRALYEKYLNFTATSLDFVVSDGTNQYKIVVPKDKYTGGSAETPGNEDDVVADLEFTAMLDTTTDKTIQIERS